MPIPLTSLFYLSDHGGYTVRSLARRVGVNASTISRIFSPTQAKLPSVPLLKDLAEALSVSETDLLGYLDMLNKPDPGTRYGNGLHTTQ